MDGRGTYIWELLQPRQADRAAKEAKDLETEMAGVDKEIVKVGQEIRDFDEQMLVNLSDQTTVEKAASKTVESTRAMRKLVRAEDVQVTTLQNELAKVRREVQQTTTTLAFLKESTTIPRFFVKL